MFGAKVQKSSAYLKLFCFISSLQNRHGGEKSLFFQPHLDFRAKNYVLTCEGKTNVISQLKL